MNDQTMQGWQGTSSEAVEKLIQERDLYEKALRNIAEGEIPNSQEYARGVLGVRDA